eukprot:6200409-Pleurochrysis_carterae.AAC.1
MLKASDFEWLTGSRSKIASLGEAQEVLTIRHCTVSGLHEAGAMPALPPASLPRAGVMIATASAVAVPVRLA